MIIQSLLIEKNALHTVTTQDTLATALSIMEDRDLRCMPILDESNTIYRGNIYKYHIYRHLARGGSLNESVTFLLKNATKFIHTKDSFYTLFFTLNDLPYISVLDEQHHFVGVIYHADVMAMLAQSWNLTNASFALSIELPDNSVSFVHVIKLIKKHTDLVGMITLDREKILLRRQIIVTLPAQFTSQQLEKLKKHLQKKNYHIIDVENLMDGV